MIVAVHALAGAVLGRLCRTPAQAFLLGALSHVVADALPHRDLDIPEEALMLGGALGWMAVRYGSGSREFLGAVGAAAPDLENLAVRLTGMGDDRMLLPTHRERHGREADSLLPQAALAVGLLLLLGTRGRNRDKGSERPAR